MTAPRDTHRGHGDGIDPDRAAHPAWKRFAVSPDEDAVALTMADWSRRPGCAAGP